MTQVAPPSRVFVLMFTDLVDSTRLKVELGDAAYAEHVARPHNEIFRRTLGEFPDAAENNYTGDGFLEIPGKPGWMIDRRLGEGGFGEVWLVRQNRSSGVRRWN